MLFPPQGLTRRLHIINESGVLENIHVLGTALLTRPYHLCYVSLYSLSELKQNMGVTEELLIRIKAEMEGVVLEVCSSKVHLAEACFKGMLCEYVMY